MRCRHAHAESSRRASGVTGRQPPARLTLRFWRPRLGRTRSRRSPSWLSTHTANRTPGPPPASRRVRCIRPRAASPSTGSFIREPLRTARAQRLPYRDPAARAARQAGARPAGQPVVLRAGAAGSIRRDPRRRPHPRVQRPRRSRHRHPHVARADRRRGTRCAGRARDDGARRHGRDTEPGPTIASATIQISATPLRCAAAQARHALLALAAERFGVDAERLAVDDGTISSDGQAITFAALVAAHRIALTLDLNTRTKDPALYRIVGKPSPRVDLPAKATGQLTFVHDMRVPGMLHGRVVRPPYAGHDSGSFVGGRSSTSIAHRWPTCRGRDRRRDRRFRRRGGRA